MNDDPRTIRILMQKAQFDLSVAIFQLGEMNAALAAKNKLLTDAQATLARLTTQLEAIASSVGANQRYVHLNRLTSQPAALSVLGAIETAPVISTSVS